MVTRWNRGFLVGLAALLVGCSSTADDSAEEGTSRTEATEVSDDSLSLTDDERAMFQFGLSADPTSAAVFDGNEHAVVATVVAVGASEAVTVTPGASEGVEGQPPVTYPFARVDVSVDEVLFGEIEAGSQISIRDLLGEDPSPDEPPPSAYEVGGQYVLMLNPAVDVAGSGLMHTPNWSFPLRDGQLLWYDPDAGTDEMLPLEEFRRIIAEDRQQVVDATTVPPTGG
jgi:hypothetical protein